MSRRKAEKVQDILESAIGKRGFIKKDEHDGFVAHYVEVYIGLLTMRFFIGDDIHPIERESHSKLVSYYWKGRTVARTAGSLAQDWNKTTVTEALLLGLILVTKP